MAKNKMQVAIITGSDSDLPVISSSAKILEEFGISYKITVASAHRTPKKVKNYVKSSERNGAEVFIAAAGMAAALPGVVASETTLPVIGVPLESKGLAGIDALFSIVQMPPGIPVGTVAIGKAGATNAGIFAVQILALKYPKLKAKLAIYRRNMAKTIENKDIRLQKMGIKRYIEKLQN
ncbi:MAG: 5-(carboxyamino)imidazole ribonucleotide mutase [Elusimicrobiota bacterium]